MLFYYPKVVVITVTNGRVRSESRVDIVKSSEHFSESLFKVIANIIPVVATGQAAATVRVVHTIEDTLNNLITENAISGIARSL